MPALPHAHSACIMLLGLLVQAARLDALAGHPQPAASLLPPGSGSRGAEALASTGTSLGGVC